MRTNFEVPEPSLDLFRRAREVRSASLSLGQASNEERCEALSLMAKALTLNSEKIVLANEEDLARSESQNLSPSLMARLKLNLSKLEAAIEGMKKVACLPDPLGEIQVKRQLYEGLILERVSVPLGVLGIIFEARPDAVIQIASLAIRSGNGVILKGGSEAENTNKAICEALREGLSDTAIKRESLELLTTRKESLSMLRLDGLVDLIIPRGSNELVRFIQDNTRIPVLGHADGICHIYVDSDADILKAVKIITDSKTHYPAACNSIETLLLHNDIAPSLLKELIPNMERLGVKMLGDFISCQLGVKVPANEEDWEKEYLDLMLSIKVVNNLEDALKHISKYGSRHTDAIITENEVIASKFLKGVDSAGVFHNCSTRFADGFRYGFGAEIGISTQTLPPRGPVGLEGLVTYKYILRGNGHIAEDFSSGSKKFSHLEV